MRTADVKNTIREIPDFPKPGINYYDLSTLFRNGEAFRWTVNRLVEKYKGERLDAVAGIEARGFIMAAAVAYMLDLGIALLRKPGKLPWEVEGEDYELEYGAARLEMHRDAVGEGQRVLIVDDVLATGGTAEASGRLISRLGAEVHGYAFVVELTFLKGRDKLEGSNVFSLLQY